MTHTPTPQEKVGYNPPDNWEEEHVKRLLLINAADDLLQALKECVEAIAGENAPDTLMNSYERNAVNHARAAIAKATGKD